MSFTLANVGIIAITLFSIIDMIGNIPLILKLRNENGGHINSLGGSFWATIIMIVFLFFGDYILGALHIEIYYFALAGSFILIMFGFKMIVGYEDKPKSEENKISPTVFPIAFPLIAGAGALSTIISFRAEFSYLEIICGILINAIIIFVVLKSAKKISDVLGKSGLIIAERVFGIILLSIGCKMFIENLLIAINTTLQTLN